MTAVGQPIALHVGRPATNGKLQGVHASERSQFTAVLQQDYAALSKMGFDHSTVTKVAVKRFSGAGAVFTAVINRLDKDGKLIDQVRQPYLASTRAADNTFRHPLLARRRHQTLLNSPVSRIKWRGVYPLRSRIVSLQFHSHRSGSAWRGWQNLG